MSILIPSKNIFSNDYKKISNNKITSIEVPLKVFAKAPQEVVTSNEQIPPQTNFMTTMLFPKLVGTYTQEGKQVNVYLEGEFTTTYTDINVNIDKRPSITEYISNVSYSTETSMERYEYELIHYGNEYNTFYSSGKNDSPTSNNFTVETSYDDRVLVDGVDRVRTSADLVIFSYDSGEVRIEVRGDVGVYYSDASYQNFALEKEEVAFAPLNQFNYKDSFLIKGRVPLRTRGYIRTRSIGNNDASNYYNGLAIPNGISFDVSYNTELSITKTIEKFSEEETTQKIGDTTDNESYTIDGSNLLQSNDGSIPIGLEKNLNKIISKYSNGLETTTILCSLSDYFDENGNKVISKDGTTSKMSFDIYDEVVPYVRNHEGKDVPMKTKDSRAVSYSVLGVKPTFDGKISQALSLQEKSPVGSTIGLKFELVDDYYTCVGIDNTNTEEIYIDNIYNGKLVKSISKEAFQNNKTIKKVIIGDGVETIGNFAFDNCTSLETVVLGCNVKTIGSYAFSLSYALKDIYYQGTETQFAGISVGTDNMRFDYASKHFQTFALHLEDDNTYTIVGGDNFIEIPSEINGKRIKKIGINAFKNSTLTSVNIQRGIREIGVSAFENSLLKDVTIASEKVSNNSFIYCASLSNVTIRPNKIVFSPFAFEYCESLTGVYIYDLKKWCECTFGTDVSNPLYYAHKLYLNNKLVEELIIPQGLEQLNRYSFIGGDFTTLYIPKSVKTIDNYAFQNCNELKTINYEGSKEEWANIRINSGNDILSNETIIKYNVVYPN